jgi:multiple sugar transport system permease protein
VSVAPSFGWPARWPRHRMRRILTEAASAVLGVVLLVWSLLPVYNMLLIALDPEGDNEFVSQGHWYLENFWSQFGNSLYLGVATAFLTMLIGSLASFTVEQMQLRKARMLTNAALLTYVLPSSFLAIPFLSVAKSYGLSDNLWPVIAGQVMFATPFAILILQQ